MPTTGRNTAAMANIYRSTFRSNRLIDGYVLVDYISILLPEYILSYSRRNRIEKWMNRLDGIVLN